MKLKIFIYIACLLILFSLFTISETSKQRESQAEDIDESVAVFEEDEDEMILVKSNLYKAALKRFNFLVVLFYSSEKCEKSDALLPQYINAFEVLKKDIPKIYFTKIDVTYDDRKFSELGLRTTPVLGFCENEKCTQYNGKTDYKSIVKYLRKRTQTPTTHLKTLKDTNAFIRNNPNVFIYFGEVNKADGTKLTDQWKTFEEIARRDDLLDYAYCDDPECFAHFQTQDGDVTLFRKNDDPPEITIRNYNEKSFKDFVIAHGFPKTFEYSEAVGDIIFQRNVPSIFYIRDPKNKQHKSVDEMLKKLVPKFEDKVKVIFSNLENEEEKQLASNFQVTQKSQLPHLRLVVPLRNDAKHYQFDGNISEDAIFQWFSKWRDGSLRQSLMSEPIPAEASQTSVVRTVVSKNFGDEVINTNRDSIVLFYSGDHLDKQGPSLELFEKIAADFKKTYKNVDFFKINSYINNVEEAMTVGEGLKIIIWTAKDKSKKVVFEGLDFTRQKIEDFLKVNLSHAKVDDFSLDL